MPSKRALASSQSSHAPTSQPSSTAARPAKRPRVDHSSQPSTLASLVPETVQASSQQPHKAPSDAARVRPPKRTLTKGTLRRLSTGHPSLSAPRTDSALSLKRPRTRPKATLSGAKVGGPSKDLADRVECEELWVRRTRGDKRGGGQGLGFAGYLKMGVGAFVERGCTSLTVNAMGAAIPLALSLALAIRDAIPGGEPPALSSSSDDAAGGQGEGEEEDDARESIVRMQVRTGSKTVADEVTPEDEDQDLVYQSRTKSTVSVELSLSEPLRSALGAAPARVGRPGGGGGRGGGSRRGKRSGRGRGK